MSSWKKREYERKKMLTKDVSYRVGDTGTLTKHMLLTDAEYREITVTASRNGDNLSDLVRQFLGAYCDDRNSVLEWLDSL